MRSEVTVTDSFQQPEGILPLEHQGLEPQFRDALTAEAPVLLAVARRILGNEAEAWDVMQSTLEIALRRQGSLRDSSALRPWLLRIETREAFRLRRRLRRLISVDAAFGELPVMHEPIAERALVRVALAHLPPRIRKAVVLHHMVGLSVADTATAVGVSENTVKSQLRVGMSRLREELSDVQNLKSDAPAR